MTMNAAQRREHEQDAERIHAALIQIGTGPLGTALWQAVFIGSEIPPTRSNLEYAATCREFLACLSEAYWMGRTEGRESAFRAMEGG